MKRTIILLVLFIFNNDAFSRVYIQCSSLTSSSDFIVLNINDIQSTLFMTNGVHRPDEFRLVKDIFLENQTEEYHIFKSELIDDVEEYIEIPSGILSNLNNNFKIKLTMTKVSSRSSRVMIFSCFNNIFND